MAQTKQDTNQTIARGAVVNILGTMGKALLPVFFILIGRMYGAKTLGIFYIAYVFLEIVASLTVKGIKDGVLMFASRVVDDDDKDNETYQVFANGFVISLLIALLLIILSRAGARDLVFSYYNNEALVSALELMVLSLPFMVVTIVVIAATKSRIIMKWEAIVEGFLRPTLMVLMASIGYFIVPSLNTLAWCYLSTWIILCGVALWIFYFEFSYVKLFSQFKNFKLSTSMIGFAIPQNLNMTFSTFITNLDVVMLGYFNFQPEIIGFYGMGAQVVRNVRQVKLAFSGAYAPIIARFHAQNDLKGMNESFSMVSRWTTTLALPISLIVVFFNRELVLLFHGSFTYDTEFMIWLLVPPILSCFVGLAGNIIVMTGHSMWNLINSISVAVLNLAFNYLMIPKYGILGAAYATVLAATAISIAQLLEANYLVGAKIIIRRVYKPWLAILPATAIAVYTTQMPPELSFTVRLSLCIVSVIFYIFILKILGIEERDREIFSRKKRNA